ncbi:MAG TPA: PQQ-dependent sugar dehydrogenase [Pyrinomonadaceae bacterium]|nr:PQQ-dependent sugar dehydrogenase [Pyrinomonadaceae bacterium]
MADRAVCAFVCALTFLFSCAQDAGRGAAGGGTAGGEAAASSPSRQEGRADPAQPFRVETVASGLQVPWSIVFAPDGRMFFTERAGRVRVLEGGRLRPEPLYVVADVETRSESGLMGLALHPDFARNRFLYLAYAYDQGGVKVRVVRFRETGAALADPKVIIEGIPGAQYHAGTRLRFGPDGRLYVTTGDAAERRLAPRLDSLAGKTLRLNDDGTVPPDNPFSGRAGARPEIYSLGHRNAQGLDFQPGTGLMFQTEHGPSGFDGPGGGDEVNIVEAGKNYGWPEVSHDKSAPGMVDPLLVYTPAVAPASGQFYRGAAFPQYRGNFFFGNLRGETLIRVVLDGRRVVSQERLLSRQYGRLREVAEGPDGAIYFSTSNHDGRGRPAREDDRILRLVPAK